MSERLIVFAHFDAAGTLPKYVRYHLQMLKKYARRLIVASNCALQDDDRAYLSEIGTDLLERKNIGYDFAAWRDALGAIDKSSFDEIVLTNSSVVGPLRDLGPIFTEMAGRKCDFWALTQSNSGGRAHLQSYFLSFGPRALRSDAWRDWWDRVEDLIDKREVISRYEIRLRDHFAAAGLTGESYIAPPRRRDMFRWFLRRQNSGIRLTPAPRYWTSAVIHSPVELIRQGLPYLKASLLWGHNTRQGVPLAELMAESGLDYDWSLIGAHNSTIATLQV
ncbi:rhamnan synthesis F family protein [Croceicoccus naphthovorans]|uniref:Uncharacterized protein n=1 Tax=Croceicoccus naphthovorans TaxID=1348774 RepID=A0A0G3XIJ6_9SPHN|nr:rhamnan synthesis F family protein [Croceicoccus naphthovorans]AKM10158.1 hypothetical protein AB433_09530 [Croceicoccus naphthovorans]MBB3990612.1 rhamnosyltransferase [Croceicoccus naphthovorans]